MNIKYILLFFNPPPSLPNPLYRFVSWAPFLVLIVGYGPMVKQREFGFHAGSTNDTEEYDIENLQQRYNFQLVET